MVRPFWVHRFWFGEVRQHRRSLCQLMAFATALASFANILLAGDASPVTPAERGYHTLTTKAFLPADFDQEIFDNLWTTWPPELREKAAGATPAERRRMTFSRYGLMERPGSDGTGTALGYLPDGNGGWVMNCLACHAGKVAGRVIPGLPNSHFVLATLTEDVRTLKLQMGKPLTHLDLGSLKIPLGQSRGTTNSVVFGVALGALRDDDLNLRRDVKPPKLLHHDVDAPPFWNIRRKQHLYSDGFASKSPRPLLQFVMLPQNSGATLRSWEGDFRDILAWIESLESPPYPWKIDPQLAETGRIAFEQKCTRCHGTYGKNASYPERIVPIDLVQTDDVRLKSLSVEYRKGMRGSWFGDYGKAAYIDNPGGYVAPPLNGIWATAPYLHNGSVPTLWHLLHPDQRPAVWKRTEDGYDQVNVGLEVSTFEALPADVKSAAEKRDFFDTHLTGKSAVGHSFPDELTEDEKHAVLEYLKTL